jgi:hypothetical protein
MFIIAVLSLAGRFILLIDEEVAQHLSKSFGSENTYG